MDLTRQINSLPKNGEVAHSAPSSNRPNESRHGEEGFEVHEQMLEQAVASLKAVAFPSVDKGSRSTVGTHVPRTSVADLRPRPTGNAGSLKAEWERPAKGRRAMHAFVALALFFTGYGAALFTDLAAPELITNLGVWAIEFSGPLSGEGRQIDALVRKSSSALDELATLRRDLKAALEEKSIAKDKEAEWMRIFAEDDTKVVALSRELEAARKEITGYIAAVGTMRSEVLEARDAVAAAEAKVQGLMLAIGVEREKVLSLTRDLLFVREELIARSATDTGARNEFLQERRTAEVTENEWKRRLDSVTQEPDQLRNRAATPANSRQWPASVLPVSELQVTPQPDPAPTWALSSAGNRDRKATPRLANRPLTEPAVAAEGSATDEATLVARAEYFLGLADIAGARLFLERALAKGSARAAFVLAQTYDAEFLQTLQTVGVRADSDKARQFYQAAAAAGIVQAQERLQALNLIERR